MDVRIGVLEHALLRQALAAKSKSKAKVAAKEGTSVHFGALPVHTTV